VLDVLRKFCVSVIISEHEHNSILKRNGFESDMPANWDGEDPFARYKAVGIEVLATKLYTTNENGGFPLLQ
jgi:hypothetical protein